MSRAYVTGRRQLHTCTCTSGQVRCSKLGYRMLFAVQRAAHIPAGIPVVNSNTKIGRKPSRWIDGCFLMYLLIIKVNKGEETSTSHTTAPCAGLFSHLPRACDLVTVVGALNCFMYSPLRQCAEAEDSGRDCGSSHTCMNVRYHWRKLTPCVYSATVYLPRPPLSCHPSMKIGGGALMVNNVHIL